MRKILIAILLALLANIAFAQDKSSVSLTVAQASQLLRERNPQLRSKALDVKDAEAQLKQSRSYDNPSVDGMYNIYNPVNHKWLDPGHDGETDISIEQPIAIGGQHNEQVRKAQNLVKSANSQYDDAYRELQGDLTSKMISLYFINSKLGIFDKELSSLDKIECAYREQTEKGNISKIELQRIQTMIFSLKKERQDLVLDANELQHDIKLLTVSSDDIIPIIDNTSLLSCVKALPPLSDVLSLSSSRPDIVALGNDVEAANHEVKLQKANALPQLSVKGEYDKNGNIGHNYFQAGIGLTIPLWNHNKGNIQSAKVGLQQAQLQQQTLTNEMQADITKTYNQLCSLAAIVATPPSASRMAVSDAGGGVATTEASIKDMIANASEQYMKRNITLLEFVDLYDSYKETAMSIIDMKEKLAQTANELNREVGKTIVNL